MIATVTNHISRGLQSKDYPANKFTWFKSNFNMPVPDVFKMIAYQNAWRYYGSATYLTETNSYDLTGFVPGYEICMGTSVWDFENNSGSTYNINTLLYSRWTTPSVTDFTPPIRGYWDYSFTSTLPAYYYTTLWYATSVGCCDWEINANGTYHYRANAVGTPNIAVNDTPVIFSNVPSTTQLASDKAGYIWVEDNNLCYICANLWKHTMVGVDISGVIGTPGVSKAGYFWFDSTIGYLVWVGANGKAYTTIWEKKQFASYFLVF